MKWRRKWTVLALLLLALVPFQNCGSDYGSNENNALYVGPGYDLEDCLSSAVDCGPSPQFMQISIDLANPSVFNDDHFFISGRCNVGNYPAHDIHWELRNASTRVVDEGDESAVCINGLYNFRISLTSVAVDRLYTAYVEMVGYDEYGARYINNQAGGYSEIDFSRPATAAP